MRLPQKKKPGDPVLAADWNLLLEAIEARTPRSGTGLEFMSSSGGFCYSAPTPKGGNPPGQPPFSVIGIAKDGGDYLVTIREGWVIERKPKTGDTPVVKFHMPKSDGTALDVIPRPQIAMAIGDTLWCKYETDAMGGITGTPAMVVSAGEPTSTHYQPANPGASGQTGIYHVKLIKLEDDGGIPKVSVYQQSDIGHWAQLWTGENIGNYGVGVFKKRDDTTGKFQFRKVHGAGGVEVALNGEYIEISLSSGAGLTGYVRYQRISTYGDPDPFYYFFHKYVGGRLTAVHASWSSTPPEGYGDLLQEVTMNNGA